MLAKTSILIADDHPIVRQGLRLTIERESDLKVVAEASDGLDALERIQSLAPKIAILDLEMPNLDGIGVMREISRRHLPVKTIFLTIYRDEGAFNQALELGANGYVLKDSAVTDIIGAIRGVAAGHNYLSPAMTTYLISRRNRAAALARHIPNLSALTTAERHILVLISEYKTSTAIAAELHISPRTVESHRSNICNKLDIHGRHALMKFALTHRSELLLQ
jgi:DNA-binding NarL/FixJ family response regulator